jgi:hypothetical protein
MIGATAGETGFVDEVRGRKFIIITKSLTVTGTDVLV